MVCIVKPDLRKITYAKFLTMDNNEKYPEWTAKPFKLTIEEIDKPHLVLDDFFSWYTLTEIRKYLRDILMAALTVEDIPASNFCFFWEQLERLTEAASIISERNQSKENITELQAGEVICQS